MLAFPSFSMIKGIFILLFFWTGFAPLLFTSPSHIRENNSWIRINVLGYQPESIKVAVWASKEKELPRHFELLDDKGKVVYSGTNIRAYGAYGPFLVTARLDFSTWKVPGIYTLRANGILSPPVRIDKEVYQHSADFALRYLRQQRCGFNPFLRDSCHTHDGFALYGNKAGIADSTHFDAVGGWHDASDYLQYATTSANATYHLLMAYRDFPQAFQDEKQANGLDGANGMADVLDEAKWGLDWLIKMHPSNNIMFNQLGDDRDHIAMRIPGEDNQYGKGFERPLYFIDGAAQQRGKFKNNTSGTSSTAAKLSSAFSLGAQLFKTRQPQFSAQLEQKAGTALAFAQQKKGVSQTVSVKSPYIYAEDNWVDDMELAYAAAANGDKRALKTALSYAAQEKITPWLITDTANHYQWYPFVNLGHYEAAKQLPESSRAELTAYYKAGIDSVWQRAKQNAFYRGVPFIWCSNNLTVAFALQCYWYKQLSQDSRYAELEQSNFDWLFGCNPWGTSMVYGLPAWSDTPTDPHSAFTHLKNYPIDGGLVDGPVKGSIYGNLIGIQLAHADEYAAFQSPLAVYHDDYGDYSTNEPTMDGTASLVYLLAAYDSRKSVAREAPEKDQGAIIRGNRQSKKMAIVFTADEFADGAKAIAAALRAAKVKASFFLTGNFYRNPAFKPLIRLLKKDGHYLGPHSNAHLLYADWTKRDSLLITHSAFNADLDANYAIMKKRGIHKNQARYFLPPYEWYNQQIADWTSERGLQLVNFSPGTRSNADYTYPEMGASYRSSTEIFDSIIHYEQTQADHLNGFILLLHLGTDPRRTDKMYDCLPDLIRYLQQQGYAPVRIDELLQKAH